MSIVANVINHLNSYEPDAHIACAIWCAEDVIGRAKERGKEVTLEQANNILDTIDRKWDATIGISWVEIDIYTDAELEEAQVKTE